jgi:hypothetical protein
MLDVKKCPADPCRVDSGACGMDQREQSLIKLPVSHVELALTTPQATSAAEM